MKIKYKRHNIIMEIMGFSCLIGIVVFLAVVWNDLPGDVPVWFDARGKIDRWDTKLELWRYVFFSAILYFTIMLAEGLPHLPPVGREETEQEKAERERNPRADQVFTDFFVILRLMAAIIYSIMMIHSILARPLPHWFFPLSLFFLFAMMFIHIYQLYAAR